MTVAYPDTTYLLKLQMAEDGTPEVRAHAEKIFAIHSAQHGRAEFASAAFRKVREGVATLADYQQIITQFAADTAATTLVLLPLTDAILDRVETAFASAPLTTYLRAADALHLRNRQHRAVPHQSEILLSARAICRIMHASSNNPGWNGSRAACSSGKTSALVLRLFCEQMFCSQNSD